MESFKCAHTEIVEIHKLQPNPSNPNKHPDKQIEMLSKIIDYQGQRSAIVVSKRSGFITKGHGRLMALQKLGWTKAAVDYQEYKNEAEEYADIIADNKIAELASHDDVMMVDYLREIDFDLDFDLLGIEDFNIETFGAWNSDLDAVDRVQENTDGIDAVIKVTCSQELKDEVLIYLKAKILETSFEGVHIE